jgi:hypothetical protein
MDSVDAFKQIDAAIGPVDPCDSAAHGEDIFSVEEICLLVQGNRDFVSRHPA